MYINMNRLAGLLDTEGTPGGSGSTAKVLGDIAQEVRDINASVLGQQSKIDEVANELAGLKGDVAKDIGNLRENAAAAVKAQTVLAHAYGKDGARQFLSDFSKFLRGAFLHTQGRKVEGELAGSQLEEVVNKAAVEFTTTTDATAGYLVPDILLPGIAELQDIYGNFYPLVTKVRVPAGVQVLMNKDAARPVATWRAAQGSAMTEESTPMSFGQETFTTELLGTFIFIANELLSNPSANFSAVAVARMVKAINDKLEDGLIKGTTGGGEPNDGIIADATSQTAIATATFANVVSFLQSCIADNEYAFNPARNKLFMTPTDVLALAAEAVGSSELTGMLVWGDPRKGVPTTLLGYEVVAHPAFNNGSKHIMLGDPSTITLGEDGAFSVDYSQHASSPTRHSFISNSTMLRVMNHYAWNIGFAAEWHKAVVTA